MFKNYLKIALRNITRQKTYSFINIAGLAVGLASFILITLYIRYEFSYESHHGNADNIYRVNIIQQHPNGAFKTSSSMIPLGITAAKEFAEIAGFTRVDNAGQTLVTYRDKKFNENKLVFADQGIFDLFTIPVIAGNKEMALSGKFSIVITKSVSEKYFGQQNPVGETLLLDNEDSFTVTAVIEDFPQNTNLSADFLISFNTLNDIAGEDEMNNWISTQLYTFLLIEHNQNIEEVEKNLNELMTAHSSTEVKRSLKLEKFSRIHLYSEVSNTGNIQYIYIFLAIGILILIIASINFMNLATARSSRRANEVGLRKVVGAGKWNLIKQFLGESIIISFLALLMALLIVDLTLPAFQNLTGQQLALPKITDWSFYGLLFIITLSVGFLSGSYPALYLSALPPVSMLRGKSGSGGNDTNLRRILVVVQFSIAIGLIISTLSINNQLNYMRDKGLGFQKEQIVVLPISGGDFRADIEPFKQTLLTNPDIEAVSGSMLLPSNIGFYNNVTWEGAQENESIALIQNQVDYDFIDTYEIEIVKGRNFSPGHSTDLVDYNRADLAGAVLLNEEAVKRFGWQDPIGKKVIQTYGTQRSYFNVVGVFRDFHFASLHHEIRPLNFFLRPSSMRKISIKISPDDVRNTIAHIRETWNRFNPAYPFEYYFLDENFKRMYQSEEKLQSLFSSFSILAIFISCLGLFGLAAFAAERRFKEIGIRKVMGASITNIVLLLSKEFTKWILVANIIAWPLAWFYLNSWLDAFAYRIEISWFTFILAAALALLIALLTVSSHAIKAATSNPVNALKYE